ncbi:hypothetical protein GFS60_06197 [Rhodococcus sp. WAY2]|nr:hypothetical protein GFS60_06197 [Rhodococcus sp. WAY2]
MPERRTQTRHGTASQSCTEADASDDLELSIVGKAGVARLPDRRRSPLGPLPSPTEGAVV